MRYPSAIALLAVACQLAILATGAGAQELPCDSFMKNDDGTWSALRSAAIHGTGQSLTIREGSVIRPGAAIRGLDLAAILDAQCPATPPSLQQPAAAVPAQPVVPRVQLGQFADANGSIDAQKLTCGQLADASPDEADVFLAWYSGWYSGAAKKRGINLARVRSAAHTVVDYCRSNPDKKVAQVIELMLK
jgi:hypothetical protein